MAQWNVSLAIMRVDVDTELIGCIFVDRVLFSQFRDGI